MNKTKHFKRLWGLMLLLVAMLMPQGAWAIDFISEVKISASQTKATAQGRLESDEYTIVTDANGNIADLNGGVGSSSDYIYIGYKTSTDASKAITGLLIVESNYDINPEFNCHNTAHTTTPISYQGKNWYRCTNYGDALDSDINRHNSKGKDITLFYTTDGNTDNGGKPLVTITLVGNTTTSGVTYARHWKYDTAQNGTDNVDVYGNTNQGNGTAHYITYTTPHTHAYSSYTTTATEHDVFCSCSTQIVDDEHHQNVNGKCSVCSHDLKDWTFFYKTKSGNAITSSKTPDFGATLLSNNYVDGQGYMNFDGPITRFNDGVFVNRTDLTGSLVIPNSVTSIGKEAFNGCTGLNGTLTLGSSLKSIGNRAFYKCSNLTGDLTIPNSVTSIGESAFFKCSGFNGKLTLSNTLSSLGYSAFETCQNLTGALTIPNTLKSIPNSAFSVCSKLTSVTFHNSLTSIGDEAFLDCSGFTGTLTIPASVTSIGAKAFLDTKFSTIRNERTTPQAYNLIFATIGGANIVNTPVKSMKLEVPSSAVAAYRAAAGWNEFKSIVCISHSLNHENTDAAYAKVPVTCTTDGTYYYSCSVCGEKSTNSTFTVAALQHDYSVMSTDEAYHKDDATCLSAATYWKKCSRCTAKSTTSFFTSQEDKDKALSHIMTEHAAKPVTCTEDGNLLYYTCSQACCSDKYYKDNTEHTTNTYENQAATVIGKLNHDYHEVVDANYLVSPATCTNDAVYHEKCSRCTTHGAIWSATGTATGNHSYTNNTLTASPVEDGLYAYACDYGCGTHTDDHIIKDFNGEGNHLELTKDGEGNYSTSEDIILADANGFVSPVDFSAPSVTYTRTGIKNQFGTLVLPFDVNGMGADYDLYKLDQVFDYELVLRKVDKGDNGGIVPAGTPVLIRLHDDLDGNYDLTLTAASNAVSCQLAEGSEADGYQLVGTYETTELSADDYFLSNNKFWNVGEFVYYGAIGVGAAPFRAYLKSTWAGSNARELSIKVEEGTLTAIEALDAITEGDAEYYDMNGRRINSLQKGVNIVKYGNGKTIKVNIK